MNDAAAKPTNRKPARKNDRARRVRQERIDVWVTSEERTKIDEMVAGSGMTRSDLIRALLLGEDAPSGRSRTK